MQIVLVNLAAIILFPSFSSIEGCCNCVSTCEPPTSARYSSNCCTRIVRFTINVWRLFEIAALFGVVLLGVAGDS